MVETRQSTFYASFICVIVYNVLDKHFWASDNLILPEVAPCKLHETLQQFVWGLDVI